MSRRLHSLKAAEVSLVPKGANGKRFAVVKEDLSSEQRDNLADSSFALPEERKYPIHDMSHARNALARASGKPEEAKVKAAVYRKYPSLKPVEKSLFDIVRKAIGAFGKKPKDDSGADAAAEQTQEEPLSREAQTALEATARILAPHKDEITDEHLDQIQEHLGIGQGEHEPEGGDGMKKEVSADHMKAAKGAALKAYKEHLEKLGYEKYPEGELQMKAADDDDEEDDGKGGKVGKEAKVLKEDGSLNLEAIPENMRPFMEVVAKEMVTSKSRADAAEARAVKLEKELADNKVAIRKSEIAAVAKGLTNLDPSSTVMLLELADAGGKEKFDAVVKSLEAQNTQMAEAKIFGTLGSSATEKSGGASSDVMAKVEKAVDGIVQKALASGVKITKEQAMADYLMEHPEMYTQEKARREASHPSGA